MQILLLWDSISEYVYLKFTFILNKSLSSCYEPRCTGNKCIEQEKIYCNFCQHILLELCMPWKYTKRRKKYLYYKITCYLAIYKVTFSSDNEILPFISCSIYYSLIS